MRRRRADPVEVEDPPVEPQPANLVVPGTGWLFHFLCPACGETVGIRFGRRDDDRNVVAWRHSGCPGGTNRRRNDSFVTSLPTDEQGFLLPPG